MHRWLSWFNSTFKNKSDLKCETENSFVGNSYHSNGTQYTSHILPLHCNDCSIPTVSRLSSSSSKKSLFEPSIETKPATASAKSVRFDESGAIEELVETSFHLGELDKCIAYGWRAFSSKSTSFKIALFMAKAYALQECWDLAQAHFQRALKLLPSVSKNSRTLDSLNSRKRYSNNPLPPRAEIDLWVDYIALRQSRIQIHCNQSCQLTADSKILVPTSLLM